MASIAIWASRIKWGLILALVVWGAFFATTAYGQCRLEGTDNLTCGVAAVFTGYVGVVLNLIVALVSFFSWLLP